MVATGHVTTHTHSGYAASVHAHAQADVTSLTADLAGKAATGHNHDASYAASGHTHADKVSDPGAWTALTLAANVQHWAGAQAVARLTDDGMIELAGSLELTGSVASDVAWADMPAGMEPPYEMRLAVRSLGTGAASNVIKIITDGTLSFGVSLGVGARLPLDNLRIRRV